MRPGALSIKNLRVDPPLVMAPMCGLSHTALRRLIAKYGGCGLFYTEMLSARALPIESVETSAWLACTSEERPIIYQLLVSSQEELPAAIDKVESCGADGLDLNMGCTAAAITKRGGGIALMKDRKRAERIVKTSRTSTKLPLTAKIRLGWTLSWNSLSDFCLMLQDSGVDAVSVHPRLKDDRLKRPARWEYIAKIKGLVSVPVIGNGDVDSPEAALRMFRQTGCDAVMIGRAAVQRPWLFGQIAEALLSDSYDQRPLHAPEAYKRFVALLEGSVESEVALPLLKKFTFYFARNYAFGHTLWRQVHNSVSVAHAAERADHFFQTQKAITA
jgi:nifR3 family TIM-barrel protein